jgi:SAM-dependent methyltransferase
MELAVMSLANSKEKRREMISSVTRALDARSTFWTTIQRACVNNSIIAAGHDVASVLYDKQANNWVRDTPNCLSDFTGRPRVFQACGDVTGKHVLDVGCGEGYCSRMLRRAGAEKIVGCDVSPEMVNAAQRAETANPLGNIFYLTCDAANMKQSLMKDATLVGMIGGAEIERGCFDTAIAVFLFNYVSTATMVEVMKQTFDLLVPGGEFVFSVPHPMMAGKRVVSDSDTKEQTTFGFDSTEYTGYFSSRDAMLPGTILTRDGKKLNVRMIHKTFEDYIQSLTSAGFVLLDLIECAVTDEHLEMDSAFFRPVSDIPLHLVFKCKRPLSSTHSTRNLNNLTMLPRQLMWTSIELRKPEDKFIIYCPSQVLYELYELSRELVHKLGINVDDFKPDMLNNLDLMQTTEFGAKIRRLLMHKTGAVIVKGFDFAQIGGNDHPLFEETVKMLYYLLCRAIGTVEESSRGRLFDVMASGLSHKADNVLFSVTDSEASWHTDGTSRDNVFDVVGLLCIRPAKEGGSFALSNACNAFSSLESRMPRFIMYELLRHLPREVMEKGQGKGNIPEDFISTVSRGDKLLGLRTLRNSYPIYEVLALDIHSDLMIDRRMRFRYMRFWIESGHKKAGLKVPPLTRIAMDFLDKELDRWCCFKERLEAGTIVFSNNNLIAHARDAFKDSTTGKPRHMVRAWIQTQVTDMQDDRV